MEAKQAEPYENRSTWHFARLDGQLKQQEKPLIAEHLLTLAVNNEEWLSFICSPTDLEALALGFLWNENVISSLRDVEDVSLGPDLSVIEIKLTRAVAKPTRFHRTSTGLSLSGQVGKHCPGTEFSISADAILALFQSFMGQQHLHSQVGGFHSAGLSDGESMTIIVEDLGRHNCVDKLAGLYLMRACAQSPRLLLLSGRISSEMVHKSLALGVQLIVSRTTPTALAVDIAAKAGITLIGYLRADGFEIYCNPQRVQTNNTPQA